MATKFKVTELREFTAAVGKGDINKVRAWIDKGIPTNFARDDTTPLVEAAKRGDIAMMELLVNAGANPSFFVDGGTSADSVRSPLNGAIARRDREAITWLLDKGANPRIATGAGLTAAHCLLSRNDRSDEWQAFVPTTLARMLDLGLPVNQRTLKGRTLLAAAVDFDHADVVFDVLLSRGADPMLADEDGYTPIHVAAIKGRVGPLRTLVSRGVSIDLPDRAGRRPLHLYRDEATAEAIFEAGPDLEARDNDGRTALAARLVEISRSSVVFSEACSRLLEAGASLDAPDLGGSTPRDIIQRERLTTVAKAVAALEARRTIAGTAQPKRAAGSPAPRM